MEDGNPTEVDSPAPLPANGPARRGIRWGIVLAGIVLGQVFLYGPSLIGKKILLPLDILAQPMVYIPVTSTNQLMALQDDTLSDLVFAAEPARQFAASEFRAGRFPLWRPDQYAGAPFQWPKFSPFKWLECFTMSPVILAWSQMAASLVAGLGVWLFFRRALAVGFWAATICAWLYPLTGFFIFWQGFGIGSAVAWMPWLLLAVDRIVRATGGMAVISLSVMTGLVLVSGTMDIAGQVLMISGLYALWRLWDTRPENWLQRRVVIVVLKLAAGWTLGFFLAMPHLLPMLEYAQTGSRMARRGGGAEERPPVGIAALPQVVLPDMYGSRSRGSLPLFPAGQGNQLESSAATYTGILATLVFAPLAWCNRRQRSANNFWAFIALFGLSWSLNLPGFVDLFRLPGLNMMSANRLVFAASFAFLALVATGLDFLLQEKISPRRWFWLPMGLLAALGLWCVWSALNLPAGVTTELEESIRAGTPVRWVTDMDGVRLVQGWFTRNFLMAALLCGAGVGVWFFIVRGKWRGPAALGGTVVLLAGDLMWFAHGRNPQCDPALYFPRVPVLEKIAGAGSGRMIGFGCLPAQLATPAGLRDIRGYDAVDPVRIVDLLVLTADPDSQAPEYAVTQWLKPRVLDISTNGVISLPPILDLFGVRHVIFRGPPPENLRAPFQGADYWVAVNNSALPRAFVPRRVELEADAGARVQKISAADFNPRDVAYVETPVSLPENCRGTADITEENPVRVRITSKMETPGLLVLSDMWDRGWRAYLDGKPVSILRANHAMRGVALPAGTATLEFRYEPASFAWGLRLAAFAAVTLLIVAVIATRRRTNLADSISA